MHSIFGLAFSLEHTLGEKSHFTLYVILHTQYAIRHTQYAIRDTNTPYEYAIRHTPYAIRNIAILNHLCSTRRYASEMDECPLYFSPGLCPGINKERHGKIGRLICPLYFSPGVSPGINKERHGKIGTAFFVVNLLGEPNFACFLSV